MPEGSERLKPLGAILVRGPVYAGEIEDAVGQRFAAALGYLFAGLTCIAGCARVVDERAAEGERLGAGTILIRIGHTDSPEQEQVTRIDGAQVRAWSDSAFDSAVAALILFVKGTEDIPFSPEEFRSVRAPSQDGLSEVVFLEREGKGDAVPRRFRVRLFKCKDLWIPDLILVSPEWKALEF